MISAQMKPRPLNCALHALRALDLLVRVVVSGQNLIVSGKTQSCTVDMVPVVCKFIHKEYALSVRMTAMTAIEAFCEWGTKGLCAFMPICIWCGIEVQKNAPSVICR